MPVWAGTRYHLRGNYCSFNCAKSDTIAKARAGTFPRDATALGLFAFQIAWKGKHCPQKTPGRHSPTCRCIARFTGILPAPDKEALEAFGGTMSIQRFRRDMLTIDSYEWIARFYTSHHPIPTSGVPFLYTLQPLRRVKPMDIDTDDDPVVLIKRRVF